MSDPAPNVQRHHTPYLPGEVDDYPLLPNEFRLWLRVLRRGKYDRAAGNGGCWDSLTTLADTLQVSERTITRTFRVLVFCGAVVRYDHPARYEVAPFSEWAPASLLGEIRERVWGKKPQRRTRRRRGLVLVPSPETAVTGDTDLCQTNRLRCPDRPSPVSQSAQTPCTDKGTPFSEGITIEGVGTHTPVIESLPEQNPKPKRRLEPLPIQLYRKICRCAPNYLQRQEITALITDTGTWERVLTQFMLENRPVNRMDWLLQRYTEATAAAAEITEPANDQPMRTVLERMESGELTPGGLAGRSESRNVRNIRASIDWLNSGELPHLGGNPVWMAPEKPADYFAERPEKRESQIRPLTPSETDRALPVLRDYVFKQTGAWPPDGASCEDLMATLRSRATGAIAT